jgi:hypothetical protein
MEKQTPVALSLCPEHQAEKLRHYCVDCSIFVCSKCLKKHLTHLTLYWDVLVEFATYSISEDVSKALTGYKDSINSIQQKVQSLFTKSSEKVTKKIEDMESENKMFTDLLKSKNLPDEKLMMLKMVASSECDGDTSSSIIRWLEGQIESTKKAITLEVNKLDISSLLETLPIKRDAIIHLFADNANILYYYFPNKKILKKYNLSVPNNVPELANSIQVGKSIYLMGGKRGTVYVNNMFEFSIDDPTNVFFEKSPMLKAKYAISPCVLGTSFIYIVGGYNGTYLSDAEKYNLATNTWSKLPSISGARSSVVTGIMNKKYLYALGGENGLTIYERMDIEKEESFEKVVFINEPSLNFGDMGCVEYPNGELFLFGLYGCITIQVSGGNHIIQKNASLIKNEYFWPYSAAVSDRNGIYGVDRYQNMHIYSKDNKKWELIPNSKWKS